MKQRIVDTKSKGKPTDAQEKAKKRLIQRSHLGCSTELEIAVGHAFKRAMSRQDSVSCVSRWNTTEDPLRSNEETQEVAEARRMLDKDKRLGEDDKRLIIVDVIQRLINIEEGKTLGDVVKECVERHLESMNGYRKFWNP